MHIENDTLTITKLELGALLAFASADFTRPHICGVAVVPETGRVFGTDGHRALICTPGPKLTAPGPLVLGRADVERLHKSMSAKGAARIAFGPDGATVWPDIGAATYSLPYVKDGADLLRPPHIDAVVPDYSNLGPYGAPFTSLNTSYLADLAKVTRAIGGRIESAELTFGPEELSPVLARFGSDGTWQAVIMPMRADRPKLPNAEGLWAELGRPAVVALLERCKGLADEQVRALLAQAGPGVVAASKPARGVKAA